MRFLLALLLSLGVAHAGQLAGVTMPDAASLAGQTLPLNGMGLREKYFIDVYVGGFYFPTKVTDGAKAVQDDVPKRLQMQFIYSSVPRDKMVETYEEGFAANPAAAAVRPQIAQFEGWLVDMVKGDVMVLDYAPGVGTTLTIKGQVKGTIPGVEFMRVVFSNYLGPQANGQLRSGLLGG